MSKIMKKKIKQEDVLLFKRRRYSRKVAFRAISKGELIKPDCCELCKENALKLDAHHIDYGKPLEVMWLCKSCHGKAHTKDHALNPDNNPQTPMPFLKDEYNTVTVTFVMPAIHYLALVELSEKSGRSVSEVAGQCVMRELPVNKGTLEFTFEEKKNDHTQEKRKQRVQGLEKNEGLLSQSEFPVLQNVRRKRNLNLSGMEGEFLQVPGGYGGNATIVQRPRAY